MATRVFPVESALGSEETESQVRLPDRDVRTALDEAVGRVWSEQWRRAIRVGLLLVLDTLAGLLGVLTVLNTWWVVSSQGLRPLPNAIPLVAMVCCIQPLALWATGAYGGGRARINLERLMAGLMIAGFAGWLQARLFGAVSPGLPNKAAYLYSVGVITLYAWVARLVLDLGVRAGFRLGVLQRRVLMVGHLEDVQDVQRRIDHVRASDVRIVSAISPTPLTVNGYALDDAIRACRAQAVLVAARLPFEVLEQILRRCHLSGVQVFLWPRALQDLGGSRMELRQTQVGALLQMSPIRLGVPQLAAKRTMDLLLTVVGLFITWPLFALIAAAIKLDSPGPVFFSQKRVGVGGRTFRMLKFRTMFAGADARKGELAHLNASGDPRLFKIPEDPRATRVGRLLRRASLDELPQVFNVLKGDMSLVGPRPFFRDDLAAYEIHHFERLHVLPGITGLWQVSGRSDVVDFEEVIRLDREYIATWSILTDLWILLRTIPAALGRGAY